MAKDIHEVIFFIKSKKSGELVHKVRCGCGHKTKREAGQCKRHYGAIIEESNSDWEVKTDDTTSLHLPTCEMVIGIPSRYGEDDHEKPESAPAVIDKDAITALVTKLVNEQTVSTVELTINKKKLKAEKGEIQHPQYERLARWIAGDVTRVWLFGPAGTGKTHACIQIAKALDIPYHLMPRVADEYQFSGFKDANGKYHGTPIYNWAKDENPRAVLILDEVDRNLDTVNIWLNSALANGEIVFPDGPMKIAQTKLVIATANTNGHGNSLSYSAAQSQDAALLDRFPLKLNWDLDTATEKAIALALFPYKETLKAVQMSQKLRKLISKVGLSVEWGPRRTFAICAAVVSGEELFDAMGYAGLNDIDEHGKAQLIKALQK